MEEKKISYVKGDATNPIGDDYKIIVHVCNNENKWGAGFVIAVSNRWPEPEEQYRHEFSNGKLELGDVQFVKVADKLAVMNMVAQQGVRSVVNTVPVKYDAVEKCLSQVKSAAKALGASVHMPKIGSGLAGGKWEEIELIVNRTLIDEGVSVVVYDYEP